tara:strand:- start:231 stop:554 length:324 start_codon:yes stop_codon:yes gene_type:complete
MLVKAKKIKTGKVTLDYVQELIDEHGIQGSGWFRNAGTSENWRQSSKTALELIETIRHAVLTCGAVVTIRKRVKGKGYHVYVLNKDEKQREDKCSGYRAGYCFLLCP